MTEKGIADVDELAVGRLYAWHAQAVTAGKEQEERRARAKRRRQF